MTDDSKRPLKVFLCHAHSDAAEVRALYTRLKADGVDAWLDKESLDPGENWEREIRKAVHEADIVIVCLSAQFNQRGFRQKEVRLALDTAMEMPEGEIYIIPARLEECDYPESLQQYHGVDLFEADGYERLMRSLHKQANKMGAVLQSKKGIFERFTSPAIKPVKPAPKTKITTPKFVAQTPRKWNVQIIVAIIGAAATILAAVLSNLPAKSQPAPTAEVTVTSQVTVTSTPALPTETNTPVVTPTITPIPVEITDDKGLKMRLVPAGTFKMGNDKYDDEKPIHDVNLDSYYMDVYEVTNAAYKLCVSDGECKTPSSTDHYNNSTYAQHPLTYVDWNQANTFCEWRGARLPTEAEWEKAARGTDGRTYPWGNTTPNKDLLNYNNNIKDTTEVGSYESGKSPYGMYDMAGNVWEWVNDWYSETYYQSASSLTNPLGPSSGQNRVLRGGSWYVIVNIVRSAGRNWYGPSNANYDRGFRCARSLPVP